MRVVRAGLTASRQYVNERVVSYLGYAEPTHAMALIAGCGRRPNISGF